MCTASAADHYDDLRDDPLTSGRVEGRAGHLSRGGHAPRLVAAGGETAVAPRRAPVTIDERQLADLKAIAAWARAEGLTGLSPASLQPADRD